jgi:hypothetical protein
MPSCRTRPLLSCAYFLVASSLVAAPQDTRPVEGIRNNVPSVHALVGARIVTTPDRTIEKGTLVIRDGVIVSAGSDIAVPAMPASGTFLARLSIQDSSIPTPRCQQRPGRAALGTGMH